MKDNPLLSFIKNVRNLFRHGDFHEINTDFHLAMENESVDEIRNFFPDGLGDFKSTSHEDQHDNTETHHEHDDETLKRINHTLKLIKEFEKKVEACRNMKFPSRE
jgi:hypothetical protein